MILRAVIISVSHELFMTYEKDQIRPLPVNIVSLLIMHFISLPRRGQSQDKRRQATSLSTSYVTLGKCLWGLGLWLQFKAVETNPMCRVSSTVSPQVWQPVLFPSSPSDVLEKQSVKDMLLILGSLFCTPWWVSIMQLILMVCLVNEGKLYYWFKWSN